MKRILLFAMLFFASLASMQAQDLDSQYATNLLKPGTQAPDFTLQTADGKNIKLNSYRGNYVILDFWASWCPDCRKDIPAMKEIWKDFMDYNVRIIGISFDTNRESWIKTYWETYQMNWTQVSELKKWKKDTYVDRLYNVDWIPAMYLIDPNGKVVLGTVEVEKLRAALESLKSEMKSSKAAFDVAPEFIGGESAMNQYFADNQLYSLKAKKMKINATLLCTFNVEMDGSTSGARVMEVKELKAGNPKFAKLKAEKRDKIMIDAENHFRREAVRLIAKMPKWTPATRDGRPVQGTVTATISFTPEGKNMLNVLKNATETAKSALKL